MLKRTFLFLLTIFLFEKNIFACSCVARTPQELFKNADYVFLGRVKSSVDKPSIHREMIDGKMTTLYGLGWVEATITIKKVWKGKGKEGETLVVRAPDQSSACGIQGWGTLLEGNKISNEDYLIFAYQQTEGPFKNLLVTNSCSGTGFVKYSEAEIKFLNTLKVKP